MDDEFNTKWAVFGESIPIMRLRLHANHPYKGEAVQKELMMEGGSLSLAKIGPFYPIFALG